MDLDRHDRGSAAVRRTESRFGELSIYCPPRFITAVASDPIVHDSTLNCQTNTVTSGLHLGLTRTDWPSNLLRHRENNL